MEFLLVMKQTKKAIAIIIFLFIGIVGFIRLFTKEGRNFEELFQKTEALYDTEQFEVDYGKNE